MDPFERVITQKKYNRKSQRPL